MRTRIAVISVALSAALAAPAPTAHGGAKARAAQRVARAEVALAEISAHEAAGSLGAELALARRWLEDAHAALRSGRSRRAEELSLRLETQIALLRAMLSAAAAEARADSAERAAFALAVRIRELEARCDALALEVRGVELTSAFPGKNEAPDAP
jgi:hypothetical protein